VYLHAMPDKASQRKLLSLTQKINEEMIKQDIPVYHPRKSMFHMTLARVRRDFPADKAVTAAREMVFARAGLRLQLCRFTLDGVTYPAKDAVNCL
jgi:2'-5' RNA ligase